MGYLGFHWSDLNQSGLFVKLLDCTLCPLSWELKAKMESTVHNGISANQGSSNIQSLASMAAFLLTVLSAPIGLEWDIWASIGRIQANQGSL
jgi:hypothetical protein